MPLKLFEALACGTPAIVTDLRAQADLVREGECGLVVPVGDADALAHAVAALAADPDRRNRLGEAGAQLVAAEHSWPARAADTASILRQAIQARR
jgi:glycosyltransferase involved in cell wall biosynthesis